MADLDTRIRQGRGDDPADLVLRGGRMGFGDYDEQLSFERMEEEILATYRERQGDAKQLQPDGGYVPCDPLGRRAPGAQDAFLRLATRSGEPGFSEPGR